jgi:hypothetical protein
MSEVDMAVRGAAMPHGSLGIWELSIKQLLECKGLCDAWRQQRQTAAHWRRSHFEQSHVGERLHSSGRGFQVAAMSTRGKVDGSECAGEGSKSSVTCNGRAAERRLGWTGEDTLVRSSPDPPFRESDKRGQGPSVPAAFNGNQDNLGQRRNSTAVTVSLSQQQARNEST